MRAFPLLLSLLLGAPVLAAPPETLVLLERPAGYFETIRSASDPVAAMRAAFDAALPASLRGSHHVRPLWIVHGFATRAPVPELAAVPGIRAVLPAGDLLSVSPAPEMTSSPPPSAWNIAETRAPEVWDLGATGLGVRVGLISTGIDPDHLDLKGKVAAFQDFSGSSGGAPADSAGIGTHGAGILVGTVGSGEAIGMAPGARLLVARAFDAGGATTRVRLLAAMQWMMDPDGDGSGADAPVAVCNVWGGSSDPEGVWFDALIAWRAVGIVPVFPVGGGGPAPGTVGFPAAYPHALAVGASSRGGMASDSSGRGPADVGGRLLVKPDLMAPGKGIVSAWPGGGWRSLSGSSRAVPHVGGALALLKGAFPHVSGDVLQAVLEVTAVDRGDPGKDNTYGSGGLDVKAAFDFLAGHGGAVEGDPRVALARRRMVR